MTIGLDRLLAEAQAISPASPKIRAFALDLVEYLREQATPIPPPAPAHLTAYDSLAAFATIQAKAGDLTIVSAPGLTGRQAWQVRLTPQSTPLDQNQRVHALTASTFKIGDTLTIGSAYYFPTDRPRSTGWDTGLEIHQPWHGGDLSFSGPSPGWINHADDLVSLLVRGSATLVPNNQSPLGSGQGFEQHAWGTPLGYGYVGPFANGVSPQLPKGRWFTLLITVRLAPDAGGWVYAEQDGVPIVPKTSCATCYPAAVLKAPDGSLDGYDLIPVNGYRQGGAGVNQNTAIHYQGAVCSSPVEDEVRQHLAAYVKP